MLFTPPIRAAHLNPPKPRRTRPMPRAHHLLRLSLPTMRNPPKHPLLPRTNRIHRPPELSCNSTVSRILQHPHPLAPLDLPANLASKLKVVALVINRPRPVRLHIYPVIGVANQLLASQRLLPRQNTHICHADNRQPVPSLRAQRSTRSRQSNRRSRLPRTQISCKQSIRNDRRRLRRHAFFIKRKRSQPRPM